MIDRKINIAIVEDNGMARINLRNHLMEMGFSGIACFANGRDLRKEMRSKPFDLIIIDFHLGDSLDGVEVIQGLSKLGLLKHQSAVIFVTADRIPLVIGQIVDIHPDDLVIKPYTIKILIKTINNVLKIRKYCAPIYELMDKKKWQKALEELDKLQAENALPKSRTALLKLRARILLKMANYRQAALLYQSVLDSAANVIWAKWGLIHATYMAGDIEQSESFLQSMLGEHLTNDKACEWLARISLGNKEIEQAESYINMIKESALSMAAARLKTYLLQAQDKLDDAIELLEKKRVSNQHIREKHAELSLELARCYLLVAEGKPKNERAKPLKVARFLIGSAGRQYLEDTLMLKRDYINVMAAVIEGDLDRANELLENDELQDLSEADVSTMTDAVKAFSEVGDEKRAAQILFDCEEKIQDMEDLTDRAISNMMVEEQEERLGERRPRALKYNKEGLKLHSERQFFEASDYFYQAYILFPKESAFGLNLLQSLVEARLAKHKKTKTLRLFNELEKRDLSESNRQRLNDIGQKISQDKDIFLVTEEEESNLADMS